jgi:hypothetical protein
VIQDGNILVSWDEIGFSALIAERELPNFIGLFVQTLWEGVVETDPVDLGLMGLNLRLYLLNHLTLTTQDPARLLFDNLMRMRNDSPFDPDQYAQAMKELVACLEVGHDVSRGTEIFRGEAGTEG